MTDSNLSLKTKEKKVMIRTVDGKNTTGLLNIIGFDRVSDFLQKHVEPYLMIHNAGTDKNKTLFFIKKNIIAVEDCSSYDAE